MPMLNLLEKISPLISAAKLSSNHSFSLKERNIVQLFARMLLKAQSTNIFPLGQFGK